MSKEMFFSIIVPTRAITNLITNELVPALEKQSYNGFELIIIPDKSKKIEKLPSFAKVIPSWSKTLPSDKRDLGAKKAKGEILAFIDSDAYPDSSWLKNTLKHFRDKDISAVCGPGITPLSDNLKERVSGYVWSTWIGAGGAGIYRNILKKKRFVDDYPTFNLLVRKSDFTKVGGFSSKFWPGEDTKLCADLVYKLGKKILYDPKVLIYHHRRPVFLPHLKQIGRFGLHRGYFVKVLPKTSLRIGYFAPLFFILGIFIGPLLIYLFRNLSFISTLYLTSIIIYASLLIISSIQIVLKEKNLIAGVLFIPAVFLTHLFYGVMFARGLVAKKLNK